jgi:hypothetical protein
MQLVRKPPLALAWALLVGSGGVTLGTPVPQDPAAADPEGIEFFEKKIRPVLAERCYECHSETAKRLKGGLRLDSKASMLKGGDTAPSIIAGDAEKSLLVKAIRQKDDDLKMPPKGKLTDEQISDFEAWIKRGAPDPRTGGASSKGIDIEKGRQHWAYRRPKEPPVPPVKNRAWVKSPIDAFVLAKLEERGLGPRAPADKRTLLRRATFDLTGLPPKPEEIEAFLADASPDAFAKAVDRLLASPRYGERWGRHWLDVARYSDTKGYVFREERRYPFSYTYRDWVVRALNEDLPYDQFLIQQIAADRLPLGDDKRPLAAMGFLTLGRRFINNVPDIIDDRLDVVCRGTMALAIGCARCHDHKFDPIPTKDYYSLYGVFASSNEPKELPLIDPPRKTPEMEDFQRQMAERRAEADKFREERYKELLPALRTPKMIAAALLAAHEARDLGDMEKIRSLAQKYEVTAFTIERWKAHLKKKDPVFALWAAYEALPEKEFASRAAAVKADGNPLVAGAFATPPASLKEAAERYAALLAKFDKEAALEDAGEEAIRKVLRAPDSPVTVALADVEKLFNRAHRDKLNDITKKIDALSATHPGAPAHAMVMVDNATPTEPNVFVRGNPNNRGDKIPRQFVEILCPPGTRAPFKDGSGRLELARAIASKDNPLTARVLVNRVWGHHFGAAIVRTPSDFGTRCDPPTHPELLDWLALRFVEDGWSLKKLHQRILLSSAWQQGSDDDPRAREMDADNKLLWRQNRQRLDLESMRDSLLSASGALDPEMGGRPVAWSSAFGINMKMEGETIRNTAADADPGQEVFSKRRTIYIFIDRQNLMGTYRDFDFASPDTHSPQRYSTTVPQQALFMMNSGFAVEQAKTLAGRSEIAGAREGPERVRQIYRVIFQRAPSADEVSLGVRFVQSEAGRAGGPMVESPAWSYGYGHYDAVTRKVTKFSALPHFTGMAWQGGKSLPDPKLGWVLLTAEGGHPGNPQQGAAIRRWTAPRDGAVSIEGVLSHKADQGDGVLARIVSSAQGEIASWIAHHTEAATKMTRVEVKKGDTIDFVVECRENESFDSFGWSPVIRMTESPAAAVGGDVMLEWSAAANFAGPPGKARRALSPWEKYAQVLLETNEFMFVD